MPFYDLWMDCYCMPVKDSVLLNCMWWNKGLAYIIRNERDGWTSKEQAKISSSSFSDHFFERTTLFQLKTKCWICENTDFKYTEIYTR